ncbi:hypothetical protein COV24_05180 [candidate division WWE3 bacterium CG10_big_fil_rev_8_21_14_0_10_32_10]|uniref:Glycosyltransferase 2-like domain-containing protein n=1 Tax=candidate division WWE3 bacterium CG10_big_fil_rev_8_21_14_0_10_32_10 TaxID=1975090 RepID=A0A2H0R9I7_UNCKA|nr:MAG: hypothetical protein COV24_05180 [candidate division WWE3 bacterium CG10_big_fil_rev_8_21_14_0_10_32_10]
MKDNIHSYSESESKASTVPLPVVMIANSHHYGEDLTSFIDGIYDSCGSDIIVLVSMNRALYPDDVALAENTIGIYKEEYGREVKVVASEIAGTSNAIKYLNGLAEALLLGDPIIEIDPGGAHDTRQIPEFINSLKEYDIALSTRFSNGGKNAYPFQRVFASWFVTRLSNIFLNTDLTDAASGFEGFRSYVLKEIFDRYPPEEWLCVTHGPMHMIQTEMRAVLSWYNDVNDNIWTVEEIPIYYGAAKKGVTLPFSYFIDALQCFIKIYVKKRHLKERLIIK